MNTRGQKKKRKSTTKTSSLEADTQEDTPPPMVTTVQDTDDNIPSTSGAVMHPVVTNRQVKQLIKDEEDKGIPSNKIFVGGFSQGGAVSLYTALTLGKPLAGVIALSSWLPLHQKFPDAIKGDVSNLPVFQGHGYEDPMVPYKWGKLTNKTLSTHLKNIVFKSYHMMHSSCEEEMEDVKNFIEKIVKA